MERLKQFMGFIMLAVVVWLLGVFTKGRIETLGVIGGIEALTGLSGLLVAVAIACWIAGSFERTKRAWIAMLIVTAAGISFVHLKLKPIETGIVWQPWSEARVAEATKAGQPVFINFTADWCLNCKYNEKFVLETAPVRAALKAKNVLPLKADFTNRDPAIAAILARFDRAGVPLYILYSGGATEPVLLPEILTQNSLLTELDRIKN